MFCPVRMVSVVDNVILPRICWSPFSVGSARGEIYNVQTLRLPCTLASSWSSLCFCLAKALVSYFLYIYIMCYLSGLSPVSCGLKILGSELRTGLPACASLSVWRTEEWVAYALVSSCCSPCWCWTIPFVLRRCRCRTALAVHDDPGVQRRSFRLLALRADSTVLFRASLEIFESMEHLGVPFGCLYSSALMQPSLYAFW